MKNRIVLFLILTVITGVLGFTGMEFSGIVGIRILFLIFADLLVISALSKAFFPETRKLRPIKVKK